MQDLNGPDLHSLRAAQGWAELGNYREANEELEKITTALRSHPDALEIRWQIYARSKKWPVCVDIAEAMVKQAPGRVEAWLHRSYALHELNRTQEAFDLLLPAATKFSKEWTVPYNLACYCSQLLRLAEAKEWCKKAMAINEKAATEHALEDPDLKPLWDSMSGTIRGKYTPYRTQQDIEPIATFGQAKLIRRSDNDYELVGGMDEDREKAKEWIALFMKGDKVRGLE